MFDKYLEKWHALMTAQRTWAQFKMHWTKADTERQTAIKLKLNPHSHEKAMNANDIKYTIFTIVNTKLADFSDTATNSINAALNKKFHLQAHAAVFHS